MNGAVILSEGNRILGHRSVMAMMRFLDREKPGPTQVVDWLLIDCCGTAVAAQVIGPRRRSRGTRRAAVVHSEQGNWYRGGAGSVFIAWSSSEQRAHARRTLRKI